MTSAPCFTSISTTSALPDLAAALIRRSRYKYRYYHQPSIHQTEEVTNDRMTNIRQTNPQNTISKKPQMLEFDEHWIFSEDKLYHKC